MFKYIKIVILNCNNVFTILLFDCIFGQINAAFFLYYKWIYKFNPLQTVEYNEQVQEEMDIKDLFTDPLLSEAKWTTSPFISSKQNGFPIG